ncbi:hypothetical protein [Marilutibacter aestuarii]|uniref:DUF4224 domain-containing protein n=1 Tax=Marilutibacter aestuarii TaxID=1706195 RepID=A0A508ARW8_9GAMM|nr:hypothetical protein [Lysobacter aestuarii]TQD51204.1 hypothetical protein FKV25_01870 [Lysobacter aestuarii]
MIGPVLQFEDLQELCQPGGHPRLATVERWAREQGVRYRYDGRGGIWTTLDALNAAIGLQAANDGTATLTADEVF